MIVETEYKYVIAPNSTLEEAEAYAKEQGVGTIYLYVPAWLEGVYTSFPVVHIDIYPQVIGE
jgi:hypothetical protein